MSKLAVAITGIILIHLLMTFIHNADECNSPGFQTYILGICPTCNSYHDDWKYVRGNVNTGVIYQCGICGWIGESLRDE